MLAYPVAHPASYLFLKWVCTTSCFEGIQRDVAAEAVGGGGSDRAGGGELVAKPHPFSTIRPTEATAFRSIPTSTGYLLLALLASFVVTN